MTSPKRYETLDRDGADIPLQPYAEGPYVLFSDVEDALEDAKRYRWLRKGAPNQIQAATGSQQNGCGPFTSMFLPGVSPMQICVDGNALDRAIDAAMQASS